MANLSAFGGAQPITPGGLVELGYSDLTTGVSVTSTTAGAGNSVSTPLTVVSDGSPLLVEYFAPQVQPAGSSSIYLSLHIDGSEVDRYWGVHTAPAAASDYKPVCLQRRVTLAAGSHVFEVKSFVSGGTGAFAAGSGGTAQVPLTLRVSKIVQQNDGLKPFWTPPVVTSLPTAATVGDQVVYAADATNGVYWSLYYDGIGTYPWKFVGGAPLYSASGTNFSTASGSFTADTNFTGITIPLAGDYDVAMVALANNTTTAFGWALWSPSGAGVTASDTYACRSSMGVAGAYETIAKDHRHTLTSGTLGASVRQAGGGTAQVATRTMTATPVRVAA